MIEYREESLSECLEEMKPIFVQHWEEIALNKDKIVLDPDYDKYFELEQFGALHIVVARDGGELVGYFISMIQPHLHYKNDLYALNDILYVVQDKRGADIGTNMFMFAEECLRSKGVSVLFVSMKVARPFDDLCLALDYTCVERSYSKYIGD